MKFKSFGPVNGNKTDSKRSSYSADPKYKPTVLPKLKKEKDAV